MNRAEMLQRLRAEREPWDVLVIGGGSTGLGMALDAAARGHRTALVEQGDFAQATSSRSTKLIHGGLRYLQREISRSSVNRCANAGGFCAGFKVQRTGPELSGAMKTVHQNTALNFQMRARIPFRPDRLEALSHVGPRFQPASLARTVYRCTS